MSNETIFSQAQAIFLEFVADTFRESAMLSCNSENSDSVFIMKGIISECRWNVRAQLHVSKDVRVEKGMLTSICFNWDEKCCRVHQVIHLDEPYFDEDIWVGERKDGGTDYGAMVYNESVFLGQLSWIQAAMMLYRMIGIPKKADRVKFVELVKAL